MMQRLKWHVISVGRYWVWGIVFLSGCGFGMSALAADGWVESDCALSRDALVPLLDQKAPSVSKTIASGVDLKSREFHQTLILVSGDRLTYTVGGCAHYGFSLQYDVAMPISSQFPQSANQVLSLLKRTPVIKKPGTFNPLSSFMRILETAKASDLHVGGEPFEFACGDSQYSQCSIELTQKRVTIYYSEAL